MDIVQNIISYRHIGTYAETLTTYDMLGKSQARMLLGKAFFNYFIFRYYKKSMSYIKILYTYTKVGILPC